MEKKEYDIVFFTNQPAFYKINLYNEIAKEKKIFVIFLGQGSEERTKDFLYGNIDFEYIYLNKGNFERRNKLFSIAKIIRLIFKLNYKLIITMGWSTIEDFLIVAVSPRRKNALVCETSIYETQLKNWKKYLKKYILSRVSYAFVSGKPHCKIFEKLNFRGKIIITGGVGLYNRNTNINTIQRKEKKSYKYLCVARLVEEKNLEFLINIFNQNGKELAIAGQGILEKKLKKIAKKNIKFLGHIPNEEINILYREYDIFILPSKSEPWGLVIEEAIINYMPVIVSNMVGCREDIVEKFKIGEVFIYNSVDDFEIAMEKIELNYLKYIENLKRTDLKKHINLQIKKFTKIQHCDKK